VSAIDNTPRAKAEALVGEVLTVALSAGEFTVNQARAVTAALEAAMAPPEGFVLVQEAPLRHLLSDAITSVEFIAGRGQSKPLSRRVGARAWAVIEALAQAGGKHAG